MEAVRAAFDKVLSTNGRAALQYGPTEGYAAAAQVVAEDPDPRLSVQVIVGPAGINGARAPV